MAVSPALSAGEVTNLAGVSTVKRYLSVIPDTTIATAQVNQISFTYPLVSLTVDNTSGGWSSVAQGQTVYIGSSAGTRDKGVYRVRKAGNSTTIFLQEMGSQDPGLLPMDIRDSGIENNDYITVMQRWDIHSILPKIDAATATISEDYELSVSTYNTTPPPIVNVTINRRRNHLFDYITTPALTIQAVASVTKWPTSSGSTLTYLWTYPAGWTGVSGSTSATLTATATPGNYVLYLAVTDSIGGVTNRVIFVNVHDSTTNPPIQISEMPRSDMRDRTGRRMSFDLYSSRLASIPAGTMCAYFEVCTWNGKWTNTGAILDGGINDSTTSVLVSNGSLVTAGRVIRLESEEIYVSSISTHTLTVVRGWNGTTAAAHADDTIVYQRNDVSTATRQFVGWLQQSTHNTTPGLRDATIDLMSPAHMLGQVGGTSQLLESAASATTWQQLVSGLCFETFVVWYMLKWRVANLLLLFNYTPFSVTAAGQRLRGWRVDKGSVLQQIQRLATERGNFGCNSEGEFFYLRHPSMTDYASRSTVVRDDVNASIYNTVNVTEVKQPRVSQVRGEAFTWDGSAATDTPYLADAPLVPGQGGIQDKLASQVVTDQDELNQLTGDYYALQNNAYPSISYTVQKNRDVIEPAEMCFVEVNISAAQSPTGAALAKNIIPRSVSKTHNSDGTADISVEGEAETHGIEADFVPVPPPDDDLYGEPYSPDPIDDFSPPSTGIIPVPFAVPPVDPYGAIRDGSKPVVVGKGAIRNTATAAYRTFDVTVASPTWDNLNVSAWFTDVKMVVHDRATNYSRGMYVLGNDGTNSRVDYCADGYAATPTWVEGAEITGIYTRIKSVPNVAGKIVIYSPDSYAANWTETLDFELGEQGFTPRIACAADEAVWQDGVGWSAIQDLLFDDGGGCNDYSTRLVVERTFSPATVTRVKLTYNYTPGSVFDFDARQVVVQIGASLGTLSTIINGDESAGTNKTAEWTGSASGTGAISLNIWASGTKFSTPGTDGSASFAKLEIDGTGDNPFGGVAGGGAVERISATYGAAWGTEILIGDATLTEGGFDVSSTGRVSLAAQDAKARIATTSGGSFSDLTSGGTTGTYPITLLIPDYRLNSTSLTNRTSSPDALMISAAQVSGDSWWLFKITGKTAVTPSVSGTDAVGVSSNGADSWRGKLILAIGSVSGTLYMFRSVNGGTTWSSTAMSNAKSVRVRKSSNNGSDWIAAVGASGLKYSNNKGVTWSTRTASGTNIYAEFMG